MDYNYSGIPKIVRSDCGTENVGIAFIQPYLRRNHNDSCSGMASFVYGKSTTNQVHMKCMLLDVLFMHNIVIFKRIEAWWSQLQKKFTYWWYSLFKVINILISQN